MPAIKQINNSDKNVAEKVNYFIDRFHHHVQWAGSEWHLELENQISLIEKILFQVSNDSKYHVEYFDNYFSHEFFSDSGMWTRFPSYLNVEPVIIEYKGLLKNGKLKKELLNRVSFHRALEKLLVELKHKYPGVIFDVLMSVFTCAHPLYEHDHIEKLNLIAKLIGSEGFFSGKAYNELINLCSRIFNKKSGAFPFPEDVKKGQRKRYLNTNNLSNQISGFKSIMQRDPHEGIIVMKAFGGVRFPDGYEFRYNDVYFLGKQAPRLKKIIDSVNDEHYRPFFEDDSCLFIATQLRWFSFYNIRQRMLQTVYEPIEYVSAVLQRSIELDNSKNFILATKQWKFKGGGFGGEQNNLQLRVDQLESLKDNAFEILRAFKKSPASKWFLSFEALHTKAHKYGTISFFWQYLEALLPLKLDGEKQVKDLVSLIILLNEKETSDRRIFQTMHDAFNLFNGGMDLLNGDYNTLPKIRKQLIKKQVPARIRKLKYPYLIELIKEHDFSFDSDYYENARKFNYGILTEAYALRNFDVHSGIINNRSFIKIQKTLPFMITRLRWSIFEAIKNSPNATFENLIDDLSRKANLLLYVAP